MELKSSCRQDERNLGTYKQSLTLAKGKVWGSHHKLCLLGMDLYFNIHGHQLIIDLPCYSALLSFPIWHTLFWFSFCFIFPLYTKKIEARETEITAFLHLSPDSPYGEGKIETIPVSPKVVPAARHIHSFCSLSFQKGTGVLTAHTGRRCEWWSLPHEPLWSCLKWWFPNEYVDHYWFLNFLKCCEKHPQKHLKTILIHTVFFSFCLWQPRATFCTHAWHSVVEIFCCHHDQAQLSLHDGNPSKLHSGIPELLNFFLHTE